MDTEEKWCVPNSDDERDEQLVTKQNGCHDLPVKILKYYEDIEKNKVLELNVKEFRKPVKQDKVGEDKDSCEQGLQEEKQDEEESSPARVEENEQQSQLEKSNEPSAFDYLDEPDDCQGQITRRTPKTGRLPKKRVGTLKNVISNLKRYKELDSSTSDESKLTTPEDKPDFESNKDNSETNKDAVDSEEG